MPLSLSRHRITPVAWHTPPPSLSRCSHSRQVILDPGPLVAHPPRGIPFLLRPECPLLPHWGRVHHGCHGLLLGHDPGPWAVEEQLLQALRTAPLHICVPSPATHVEVFGVTRGHSVGGGFFFGFGRSRIREAEGIY